MTKERLHSHQKKAPKRAWKLSKEKKNVLIVSPGGSGKTFMIALLTWLALREHKRVLILVHRMELIDQAFNHLVRYGIDPERIGVLGMGRESLPDFMSVLVASLQSYRRRDIEKADIVIIDEAHHAPARTYREIIDQHPRGTVFGLTATPVRLDGVGFRMIFDEMLIAATNKQLLKKKLISAPTCWGPRGLLPDLSDVPTLAGDFESEALARVMDREELAGNTVEEYKKHALGQRAIGFAITIAHAEHLTKRFKRAGIPSEYISGEMSFEDREAAVERLRSGETHVLWTCQLANEGLDIPAVRVVMMARPTKSYALFSQQASRCKRLGPPPKLLDHAGNVIRFGYPHRDPPFSLDGVLEEVPEDEKVKECPACGALVECGVMECPECGHAFPAPVRRVMLPENGEGLVELTYRERAKEVRAWAREKGLSTEWVKETLAYYKKLLVEGRTVNG